MALGGMVALKMYVPSSTAWGIVSPGPSVEELLAHDGSAEARRRHATKPSLAVREHMD
jgi:hypothetical protein